MARRGWSFVEYAVGAAGLRPEGIDPTRIPMEAAARAFTEAVLDVAQRPQSGMRRPGYARR